MKSTGYHDATGLRAELVQPLLLQNVPADALNPKSQVTS